MQRGVLVGALVAMTLVGGAFLWLMFGHRSTPRSLAASHRPAESPPAHSEERILASPAAGPTQRVPEAASVRASARRQPGGQRRAFDRLRADGVRQRAASRRAQLHANAPALTAPSPASAASTSAAITSATSASRKPSPVTPEGEQRREYIREAVREQYLPIARSCYEELLERQPTVSGKVVMSFAIVGDGEDGVVDRVELDDDTTIDDPEFTLCMRESMYTTIFDPPPPGADETTVVYPIVLDPGPP